MFFEVIHNMLNGQKLKTAFKSVFTRKKLVKNLPKNLQKYQKALDTKIGYYIEESEFSNEYTLNIIIMTKDTIINYSMQEEDSINLKSEHFQYFKNQKFLENLDHKDTFFNQEITRKIWLLENKKVKLFEHADTSIIHAISEELNKGWKGKYQKFDKMIEKIAHDIVYLKSSSATLPLDS